MSTYTRFFSLVILGGLLIHLAGQDLRAQDPFYHHYDTETGLPSAEVYDVIFDEWGMGWFPTDRGLCSYDGYSFKVYTTEDGLTNNTILDFKKDPHGRIWMMTLDGSIFYLDQSEIHAFKGNDKLGAILGQSRIINDLAWDSQGRMVLWHHNYYQQIERYFRWDPQTETIESFSFSCMADEYPIKSLFKGKVIKVGSDLIPQRKLHYLSTFPDSTIVYAYGNTPNILFWEDAFGKSDSISIPGMIHTTYYDHQGQLWVGSSQGVFRFKNFKNNPNPEVYFSKTPISRISRGPEGNYWVCSLSDGIKCIPSFDFKRPFSNETDLLNQPFISLSNTDQYLVAASMAGEILVVDSAFSARKVLDDPNKFGKYSNPHVSNNKVFFNSVTIHTPSKGEIQVQRHTPDERHVLECGDSVRWVIGDSRIRWIDMKTEKKTTFHIPPNLTKRAICALQTDSCIWIGSNSGLLRLNLNQEFLDLKHENFGVPALNGRINDLKGDSLGKLYAATNGSGLVILDHNQHLVVQKKDGLSSNMINRIGVQNAKTLWVGTNQGLDRVNLEGENILENLRIHRINTLDGLPNDFIRDVRYWNGQVWVTASSGLVYFDPHSIIDQPQYHPKPQISHLTFNQTDYLDSLYPKLNYNQNNLNVDFQAVSFQKSKSHPFYRYRLLGSDSIWRYTNNRNVQFSGLNSGNYTFEVNACNRLKEWGPLPSTYHFSIRPHFSQTWWFIGLLLLGFALLIVGIAILYIRQRRKEDFQLQHMQAMELKAREAELAALRNQMNPHFVFNTLNAIQHFIFKRDVDKSSYYLGQFANLMRDGLEFSLQSQIPLSEELEFLRTYLELEMLRFPDRFVFEISIDDALDADVIELPPFLFQPVLENSIKHGFKDITYQGILTITITGDSESGIAVNIQDNGSGIMPKAPEIYSSRPHTSRGLQIVQNHIDLVNHQMQSATFEFRNRSGEKGTQTLFKFVF